MQFKKSTVIISLVTLGLFVFFFGIQHVLPPVNKIIEEEPVDSRADSVVFKNAPTPKPVEVLIPSLPESPSSKIPTPSNEDEKLNALQKEIATLSNSEIATQTASLKSKIHEANLIERLNKDQVNDEERERAKEILVRLALLGVEKAKRGLEEIQPEMENALKKHEETMAEIKDLLND